MKKLLSLNTLAFALLLGCVAIFMSSCGDDEPDTPPVLDREVFIGAYLGTFNCPGDIDFANSDSLVFSIDPAIAVTDLNGIILNLSIDGNPLALAGSVSGDTLFIMDEITGVPIDIMGLSVNGNVAGDGSATIANNNLSGEIELELSTAGLPIVLTDKCVLTGEKQ